MDITIFTTFDDAANAESKRSAPKDFTESMKRLEALINFLPQRKSIEDHHVERWLNRTIKMAIERMELEHGEGNATIGDVHAHCLWHVRRASGIGGSEVGTIVRHFRGETGGFTNARNLVLEKLLIMAPMPGTDEMSRGIRAEPWLQKIYLQDTGGVSQDASIAKLKGFRWDRVPYMIGTPDDIVLYPNGRVEIIDYKCPSADVNEDYEKKKMVSFDYVCLVHDYAVLAKAAGVQFNGMSVCCFDPRFFRITPYKIEPDKELVAEMVKSVTKIWEDFVMNGVVPEVPGPAKLDVEDPEIKRLTRQAAVLKQINKEIFNREKEVLSRIAAIQKDELDLAEGKVDVEVATFTRKRVWNEGQLTEMAKSIDLDPAEFMVETKKTDAAQVESMLKEILAAAQSEPADLAALVSDMAVVGIPKEKEINFDGLAAALEEAGVSTKPAMQINEAFALSRGKKNAEKVHILTMQAVGLVDTIEEIVEKSVDTMFDAPEVEDNLDDHMMPE